MCCAHVVVVALSAHLLDHHAEQDEAVVAVRPAAARRELESPLAVQLDVVIECAQRFAVGAKRGAEDVAGAAGVGQQLMDGHLGRDLPVGVVADVCAERSGELDLAGLDQLEDRQRREHLVHRADAKPRADSIRDPSGAVGQPVSVAEQHAVVPGDQHSARQLTLARELTGVSRQRLHNSRFAHPTAVEHAAGAARALHRGLGARRLRPSASLRPAAARGEQQRDHDADSGHDQFADRQPHQACSVPAQYAVRGPHFKDASHGRGRQSTITSIGALEPSVERERPKRESKLTAACSTHSWPSVLDWFLNTASRLHHSLNTVRTIEREWPP